MLGRGRGEDTGGTVRESAGSHLVVLNGVDKVARVMLDERQLEGQCTLLASRRTALHGCRQSTPQTLGLAHAGALALPVPACPPLATVTHAHTQSVIMAGRFRPT
jgi:hypothetical protein